jgi:hypothetical protein
LLCLQDLKIILKDTAGAVRVEGAEFLLQSLFSYLIVWGPHYVVAHVQATLGPGLPSRCRNRAHDQTLHEFISTPPHFLHTLYLLKRALLRLPAVAAMPIRTRRIRIEVVIVSDVLPELLLLCLILL